MDKLFLILYYSDLKNCAIMIFGFVILTVIHMMCIFFLYQVCQHEQEQAMLKERARKLERRLGTLDSEYTQQMDNLRAAYHKTLSTTLDRDLQGEENIRQRYQAEIEHLRVFLLMYLFLLI